MNTVFHSVTNVHDSLVFGELIRGNGAFTVGRLYFWAPEGYPDGRGRVRTQVYHTTEYIGDGTYRRGIKR